MISWTLGGWAKKVDSSRTTSLGETPPGCRLKKSPNTEMHYFAERIHNIVNPFLFYIQLINNLNSYTSFSYCIHKSLILPIESPFWH